MTTEIAALRRQMTAGFSRLDDGFLACEAAANDLKACRLDGDSQEPESAVSPSLGHIRTCPECGRPYAALKPNQRFCCSACAKDFNNRRATRGVLVFDLLMCLRHERGLAGGLRVWRAMCRLAEQWRAEDMSQRDGRKSWGDARELLEARPYLTVERLARTRRGRS